MRSKERSICSVYSTRHDGMSFAARKCRQKRSKEKTRGASLSASAVNGIESVALSVGVVASVVIVHELGHFVAARVRGIRVTKFALGFGPTIVSYSTQKGIRLNEMVMEKFANSFSSSSSSTSSSASPSASSSAASSSVPRNTTQRTDSVEYALNLLPLGGFVAFPEPEASLSNTASMQRRRRRRRNGKAVGVKRNRQRAADAAGDARDANTDDDDDDRDLIKSQTSRKTDAVNGGGRDPDLLRNRPALDQLLVAAAGVLVNMCVALLISFTTAKGVGVPVSEGLPGVRVPVVTAGGAASTCGLMKGDIISAIDGIALEGQSRVDDAVRIIGRNAGREIELSVGRQAGVDSVSMGSVGAEDGKLPVVDVVTVRVTPRATGESGTGRIGVQLIENAQLRVQKPRDAAEALRLSVSGVVAKTRVVVSGLVQILKRLAAPVVRLVRGGGAGNAGTRSIDVKGPIGIVSDGAALFRRDTNAPLSDLESKLRIIDIANYAVYLNINLAVVNALPVPGLDGGYILDIIISALKGKLRWIGKRRSDATTGGDGDTST